MAKSTSQSSSKLPSTTPKRPSKPSKLTKLDTYVFIDVSNIRSACLKTLNLRLDFPKLLSYFKDKYPNLRDVRYYEGISNDDTVKRQVFKQLQKLGYTICPLSRKSYTDPASYRKIKCRKCGHLQKIKIHGPTVKMKSNVDVYLATELAKTAYLAKKPLHIILLSCDGDYAETIKSVLETNQKIYISVMATPTTRVNNTLSTRIKALRHQLSNFQLINIKTIDRYISSAKIATSNKNGDGSEVTSPRVRHTASVTTSYQKHNHMSS